jgi:hypothetical protein
MKTDAVSTRSIRAEETSRQIALRTRGHSHGRVTRLVSPGDIGELSSRSSFSTTSTPILRPHQNSAFIPIRELRP